MPTRERADARHRGLRKCSACSRARELEAVTLGFARTADGPFYLRQFVYVCEPCRSALDRLDEMIGPTLEAAICTMLRAMGRR